ncbi:MAG: stage III sporulation protein AB [Oscillospiraceae bacterium]|nr:stage III sporulation protein AB [Oscillospiraceae bacterium]
MLKLAGCLLIVASSVYAALSHIKSLRKRAQGITAMVELLSAMKIKINYEFTSLPELLKSLRLNSTYPISLFLDECVMNLNQGENLKSAWKKSVDRFSDKMNLTQGDINILSEFSLSLGDSDVGGQISNIQLYTEMLRKNLSDAESIIKDKSRITLSCSLFGGLIFLVLLI